MGAMLSRWKWTAAKHDDEKKRWESITGLMERPAPFHLPAAHIVSYTLASPPSSAEFSTAWNRSSGENTVRPHPAIPPAFSKSIHHQPVCLSIHPYIHTLILPYISIHPFVHSPIVNLPVLSQIYLSIHPSTFPFIHYSWMVSYRVVSDNVEGGGAYLVYCCQPPGEDGHCLALPIGNASI